MAIDVKAIAKEKEGYLLDLRHEFHMYPEIACQEERTSARIAEELKKLGIPYELVGNRNVVGIVKGNGNGPDKDKAIAMRADFDALPMEEEIDWEFKSKIPGVSHACGHDSHAACLLAAAACLNELKDQFSGTVYLCFQIAEEISGGGAQDLAAWLQKQGNIREVLAQHISASNPVGEIHSRAGSHAAGNCHWKVTVHGSGGHGSRPDMSVDPLRPACMILNALAMIPSNYSTPFEPLVVSPCMIHGGTAFNIIPDTCTIDGNLRFFNTRRLPEILAKMEEIAKNIAAGFGATVTIDNTVTCYPVTNDKQVTARCRSLAEEMGFHYVENEEPGMGSDDFCYFSELFPSCYYGFGALSDMPGASPKHHNTKFFLNEDGFLPTVEFFLQYVLTYMPL
ncbi:MAG: amidohydrolase [Firmicutes bacterium]|nr:amidohydrolase [Bacillota bacterium]